MVFDFAAQPPELISAKIYSGPGTASLQAAAAAWDALSSELQSTAASYQSIILGWSVATGQVRHRQRPQPPQRRTCRG